MFVDPQSSSPVEAVVAGAVDVVVQVAVGFAVFVVLVSIENISYCFCFT